MIMMIIMTVIMMMMVIMIMMIMLMMVMTMTVIITVMMTVMMMITGLKITAGQRTMSSLIVGLTGQTFVWPVIFGCLSLNAFCSITL